MQEFDAIVSQSSSSMTEAKGNKNSDNAYCHKPFEVEVGKDEVGKVKVGKFDQCEVSKVGKAELGKAGKIEVGKTGKLQLGKHGTVQLV